MAINFPTSLDALTNPASSDQLSSPSHSAQHANANDAIEALQTKVGVNNSAITTTLDYRVKQLETVPTYTNEMAQDAVAAALAAGTHTNITINYNDTGNSISISAAAGYTNEEAVDAVAAALTQGSGISIAYNDAANTITISVDSSVVLKTGATMTGALTLSGAPTTGLHAATKTYVDTATATVTSNSTTTYIPLSSIGIADGVASLNSSGVIPDAQIPAAIARDSEVSSAISTEVTNRNSAISTAVSNLVNSAPNTLDTLNELATALGNDANFATTTATSIGNKVSKAGGDTITSSTASTVPLVLKAAASQTANIFEWQNSAGTVLSKINQVGSGVFGNGTLSAIGNLNAFSSGTTVVPLVVQGIASQTAKLQEWQNSAGTVVASTSVEGNGYFQANLNAASIGAGNNIGGASLTASPWSAATVVSIIRGYTSQASDLTQWQNSAGSIISRVSSVGSIFVSSSGTRLSGVSGDLVAIGTSATVVPITSRGIASQTADLQQWQDSTGTVLGKVDSAGHLNFLSKIIYANQMYVGTGNYLTATMHNTSGGAGEMRLLLRAHSSQTASIQEWQNSAGTALAKIDALGNFTATSKSFDIIHPTKENMRLRYGSLEGPENGVYIRGTAESNIIELPDYWTGLVHSDSITVSLTSVGSAQNIYVEKIENNKVYIGGNLEKAFFTVYGERKDIDKLTVEY